MKLRTLVAGLSLVLALGLVLSGNRFWAALLIVLWILAYYLSKSRPLAIQDIPLHELNEKYAIHIIPRSPDSQISPAHYRSRYINLRSEEGAKDTGQKEPVRYPMVHYCDNEGSGPIVVLLHGIMDSSHGWEGWIENIGADYRMIAVDLPGFGLTGPLLSGEYSMETMVEFVGAFVDALDLGRFHLVGNSLGGAIAWNYAIDNSRRVGKLVLIDPAGFPQDVPEIVRFVSLPIVGRIISAFTPRFIFSRGVRQVYGNPDQVSSATIDRFFEIALRPGSRSAVVQIFRTMRQVAGNDEMAERIAKIDDEGLGPHTLLMWGEEDRWIPVSHVQLWRETVTTLPVAHCKVYGNLGHIPHEEDPRRTSADAHKFFSQDRFSAGRPA